MANNFRITLHRKSDNLWIQLAGDFDGSSAYELLNTVQENLNKAACIFIDTGRLKKIYPFGREVFGHHLLELSKLHGRIRFVGKNAGQLTLAELEYLRIDRNHHDVQQEKSSLITIEAEYEKRIDRV